MFVRLMEPRDVPVVTRLGLQLGYPVDEVAVARRLERYGGLDTHLLVVAEQDGVVVGWAHILERALLQEPLHAEIGGLVVDETARGSGVGKALIDAIDAWASARAYHGLWLHSRIERPEAHAFYPALGFDRIKTSHVYYRTVGTPVEPRRPGLGSLSGNDARPKD
jgi:GNAT superfamily N-acetyltransferase